MSIMFDLEALADVLQNPPVHIYKGTCEVCSHASRLLSSTGGVLMCDLCRNTIAHNIKEQGYPSLRKGTIVGHMDPSQKGGGIVGQRQPVPGQGEAREKHTVTALSKALKEAYNSRPLSILCPVQ